jgi:hypothetical protein
MHFTYVSGDENQIFQIFHRQCASACMCYTVCLSNTIEYCSANAQLFFVMCLVLDQYIMNGHLQRVLHSDLKALVNV